MSSPRPEVRIGDRERDLVTSVLQDALAEGRLTLEELDVRLDATLKARTYADLDALVADLPVEPPSAALTASRPVARSRQPVPPGHAPEDRLVLDAGWSSVARSGRWDLPPFLQLNGAMGTVKLNCLQANPLAPLIDIQVSGGMGNITIVVPDTWAANTDRLTSSWGSAKVKVSPTPGPDAPLLVLHGSVGWGWLKIRYANGLDRRRLEKQGLRGSPRPPLTR
ncbi:DUF1707 domain-containing protein [Microlunatus lacustris]